MMPSVTPHNFIAESRELLHAMEEALLVLGRSPQDGEALHAVFRAMHTIKGSAGVFGFDEIVAFTHVLEELVDEARRGAIPVDDTMVSLLLGCGDHVAALVDALESADWAAQHLALQPAAEELLAQVRCFLPDGPAAGAADAPAAAPQAAPVSGGVANDCWHISARFGREVLRHGMDPLSVLRYLGTIGTVECVKTVFDAPADAAEMDAESCYLGVEIRLRTGHGREAIEGAFEFLRDGSRVVLLAPHASLGDYADLLGQLGEEEAERLLVDMGALSAEEAAAADALLRSRGAGRVRGAGSGIADDEAPEQARPAAGRRRREARSVRVDAEKLDDLINLVGELVIASAGVNMTVRRSEREGLVESAAVMQRLVEEVRDSALKLRMVPIGETFGRFQRVVHDLGRELGKDVALELNGTETELDKSMVEKLSDPLTHLVRNAMDHGIETADERERGGKPRRGVVRLNAYHDSGSIVVEVSDDGAGLDAGKIARRAAERGLIAPGQALGEREIHRLIMEPGFSTAEGVTSVSGRGVGMDVVRRNVEALRGSISIASTPGRGTGIAIRLPLTLAIIDGFVVGVGQAMYVMPLEVVVECLELSEADRAGLGESGFINLRGEVLPVLRLREVFGGAGGAGKRENIVVVQYGGQRAGFAVDALLGEFQTVIKPLGKLFERLAGFSGTTILGSGEVGLILDVPALVQRAIGRETGNASAPARRTAADSTSSTSIQES